MPTQNEHLIKAEGNALFARNLSLQNQTEIDWAHIAIFYSALHYIEAYLVKTGKPCTNHSDRNHKVVTDPILKNIRIEYHHLKHFGHSARYLYKHLTAEDVMTEALPDLETITTFIKGLL